MVKVGEKSALQGTDLIAPGGCYFQNRILYC